MAHVFEPWKDLGTQGIRKLWKISWTSVYEAGPYILSFYLQPMSNLPSYQQKTGGTSLSRKIEPFSRQWWEYPQLHLYTPGWRIGDSLQVKLMAWGKKQRYLYLCTSRWKIQMTVKWYSPLTNSTHANRTPSVKFSKKTTTTRNQTYKKLRENRKRNKDQNTSKDIFTIFSKSYEVMLHSQSKGRMLYKVNNQSTITGLWILKIYEN